MKMNNLSTGMAKADVIKTMGNPSTTKAQGDRTVLEYNDFWTCTSPNPSDFQYWVILENVDVHL
jgi:hypothetical protein